MATTLTMRAFARLGWLALIVAVLAGCQNARQPQASGQAADPGQPAANQLLARYGGAYGDSAVLSYVERVGARVLAASPLAPESVRFVVLDTDVANAFVVSGGTIFVTRGLLTWLNSEAELAAVIAHEIGHLSEDHAAESRRVAQDAARRALVDEVYDRDAAERHILRYSREQELEADRVGYGFLTAAGYAGHAMLRSQGQFDAGDRVSLLLRGLPPTAEHAAAIATHPSSTQRLAALETLGAGAAAGEEGRDAYLAAVEGLPFGPSADDWRLEGASIVHPGSGIAFPRPDGYALEPSDGVISGSGPAGDYLRVDFAARAPSMRPEDYVAVLFAQFGEPIVGMRQAGGFSSAAVAFSYDDAAGEGYVVAGAVALTDNVLLRVLTVGTTAREDALRETYDLIVEGLEHEAAAASGARPVLTVHIVAPGETVAGLARSMTAPHGQAAQAEPLLRALNGLAEGEPLVPGQPIKLLR